VRTEQNTRNKKLLALSLMYETLAIKTRMSLETRIFTQSKMKTNSALHIPGALWVLQDNGRVCMIISPDVVGTRMKDLHPGVSPELLTEVCEPIKL
jgi:hypothetical protein